MVLAADSSLRPRRRSACLLQSGEDSAVKEGAHQQPKKRTYKQPPPPPRKDASNAEASKVEGAKQDAPASAPAALETAAA